MNTWQWALLGFGLWLLALAPILAFFQALPKDDRP